MYYLRSSLSNIFYIVCSNDVGDFGGDEDDSGDSDDDSGDDD